MKLKIEYSPEDIEELISSDLEKRGYIVGDFRFVVCERSTGYGHNEKDEAYFSGVEVKAESK